MSERGRAQHSVTISTIISQIGKAARVQVATRTTKDKKTGEPVQKVKFASSYDLRRSFGTRWAPRLKPLVLQMVMGHKSLTTTQQYYVSLDADEMARDIWRQYGGQNGDMNHKSASVNQRQTERKF